MSSSRPSSTRRSRSPEAATNEVGDPHTFTVTVIQNHGTGGGFVAATEGNVDFTLTDSNGAVSVLDASGEHLRRRPARARDNLNASGQCVVVFTSPSAGQVTGNASVTLVVGGLTLTRDTDPATTGVPSGPGGSGPAVKTFVDAKITHCRAARRTRSASRTRSRSRSSWTTAPVRASSRRPTGNVDVTLTDSNGAVFGAWTRRRARCDDDQPAGDNLDGSGQCTVVFTSTERRPGDREARPSP